MSEYVPLEVRHAVHGFLMKNTALGVVEDFLRSQSKTKILPFIDGYLNGVFDGIDGLDDKDTQYMLGMLKGLGEKHD